VPVRQLSTRAAGRRGRKGCSGAHPRHPDGPPVRAMSHACRRRRGNAGRPARETLRHRQNGWPIRPKSLANFEKGRFAAVEGGSKPITNAYG
jgi:hypothetical protein